MHIPCQFSERLDQSQKNNDFFSRKIELAQKMQKGCPIFVICKERYCQICRPYGNPDDMFAEKYFLFLES